MSLSTITDNWLRISRALGCHKPTLVFHFHLRIVSDDGRGGSIQRCIICIIYSHLMKLSPAAVLCAVCWAGGLHFIHSFYWASCTLRWQHMKGNSVICQMYSVTWFSRYYWEAIWNITWEYKVFPADCKHEAWINGKVRNVCPSLSPLCRVDGCVAALSSPHLHISNRAVPAGHQVP